MFRSFVVSPSRSRGGGCAGRSERVLVAATLAGLLAACAPGGVGVQSGAQRDSTQDRAPSEWRVDGNVTYRERVTLPAGSVVRVILRDAAEIGANPATSEVASQEIITVGEQVPLRFELAGDGAQLDPRGTYTIEAEIEIDGQVRFTTTLPIPVLTRGAPSTVDIVVSGMGYSP